MFTKNKERCDKILKELKNTNNKTAVSMKLTSNISEGFTNNDENGKCGTSNIQTGNQNIKNIQTEIRELEKKDII